VNRDATASKAPPETPRQEEYSYTVYNHICSAVSGRSLGNRGSDGVPAFADALPVGVAAVGANVWTPGDAYLNIERTI